MSHTGALETGVGRDKISRIAHSSFPCKVRLSGCNINFAVYALTLASLALFSVVAEYKLYKVWFEAVKELGNSFIFSKIIMNKKRNLVLKPSQS